LGLHPLFATRADTGEVLHARLRKGSANTQRGGKRFIEELVARLKRAGATGTLVMRFDSGFRSKDLLSTLERLKLSCTMAVRAGTKAIAQVIATIADDEGSRSSTQKVARPPSPRIPTRKVRIVVRRTRLVGSQATLWPDWRHFAFLTDLATTTVKVDAFHRERAQAELDIRDLKESAGREHYPSGSFAGNAAWLQYAVLAHNLLRWTRLLGGLHEHDGHRPAVARTIRTRFVSLPGRLVNRSGTPTLRAPGQWP